MRYMETIFQHLLVSFCLARMDENNKKRFNFRFTSWKDLKFQPSVWTDILVTRL